MASRLGIVSTVILRSVGSNPTLFILPFSSSAIGRRQIGRDTILWAIGRQICLANQLAHFETRQSC